MSRTTTALKRLGVPSLAAVTLCAGLPLFAATAQAAHTNVTAVTITPAADTAAAGTCNLFRIDVQGQDVNGNTVAAGNERIDVVLSEADTDAVTPGTQTNANQDPDFCNAPVTDENTTANTGGAASVTPQTGQNTNDTGAAGDTDRAEFVTNADGVLFIGVVGNTAGTINIQAFADRDNDNTRDAVEPQDTAVLTVVAGGSENVNNVDATPENATNVVGETHVVRVRLSTGTDGADVGTANDNVVQAEPSPAGGDVSTGEPVAGVTPTARVSSSTSNNGTVTTPNTALECSPSNNNGIATCTYTSATVRTDTIQVFVNQQEGNTAAPEAGEPLDVVRKSWIAAQANRSINVVCTDEPVGANAGLGGADGTTELQRGRTSDEDCINTTANKDRIFRAIVDTDTTANTATTEGTLVAFTVTGGSGDETAVTGNGDAFCATQNFTAAAGDTTTRTGNSFCDVTINDPTPTPGQVLTVTGTVRGTQASDSGTLRFFATTGEARTIEVTSNQSNAPAGGVITFIATVLDAAGKPVPGVEVTFLEDGAGAFRTDSTPVTDANGRATVELATAASETGSAQVTGTISGASTECDEAANAPTQGDPAGRCADSETATFGAAPTQPATPTASATPTTGTQPPSPSPTGVQPAPCTVPASITLDRTTITATGSAQITVRATPNSIVDVFAYSRPSTTYRVVRQMEIGGDGVASDRIVPPTNTRLYAQQRGCNASPSIVLNVRTALSLNVTRTGVRAYRFFGDSLPARPGGLIISLYRVTNDGRQILTSQVRANPTTGDWVINRVFTGTGRFGFVVRTGQDLQNAPGSSNVRSLLVF